MKLWRKLAWGAAVLAVCCVTYSVFFGRMLVEHVFKAGVAADLEGNDQKAMQQFRFAEIASFGVLNQSPILYTLQQVRIYLGTAYLEGRDGPPDYEKAAEYFHHADVAGTCEGLYGMAVLVRTGRLDGVPDYEKAVGLYRRAAGVIAAGGGADGLTCPQANAALAKIMADQDSAIYNPQEAIIRSRYALGSLDFDALLPFIRAHIALLNPSEQAEIVADPSYILRRFPEIKSYTEMLTSVAARRPNDVHMQAQLGLLETRPFMAKAYPSRFALGLAKLRSAAERGDILAINQLTEYYAFIKPDTDAALHWIEKGIAKNDPLSAYYKFEVNYRARYKRARAAVDKLYAGEPTKLSDLASKSDDQELQSLHDLLLEAASGGVPEAQEELASRYFHGNLGFEKDFERGGQWGDRFLRQAPNAVHKSEIYFYMAKAYLQGLGVAQDTQRGCRLLENATGELPFDPAAEFRLAFGICNGAPQVSLPADDVSMPAAADQ